jgi:hypothetical protein
MLRRWVSTVFSLRNSTAATSLLVLRSVISATLALALRERVEPAAAGAALAGAVLVLLRLPGDRAPATKPPHALIGQPAGYPAS